MNKRLTISSMKQQLALFLAVSSLTGCGSRSSNPSSEQRERLRQRAALASDVDYRKPLGRKNTIRQTQAPNLQNSSPKGSKPSDDLDAVKPYSSNDYLTAEGFGETRRAAELDAASRLSAKIKSEVKSVIRSTVSSKQDAEQEQTSDESETEVSTHFTHAELIEFSLLPSDPNGLFKALARLDKQRYRSRVKVKLQSTLERLITTTDHALKANSLHEQTMAWHNIKEQSQSIEAELVEYEMILGERVDNHMLFERTLNRLRSKLSEARSKLVIIFDPLALEQGEAEELEPYLNNLIKAFFRAQNLKLSLSAPCAPNRYRLQLRAKVASKRHPLTGGEMSTLHWNASLITCAKERADLGEDELISVDLPILRGAERYQISATRQLIKNLNVIKKELAEARPKRSKTGRELNLSMLRLLKFILPSI